MDQQFQTPPRKNSSKSRVDSYKNYDKVEIKRSLNLNSPPPPPPPSPISPVSKQQIHIDLINDKFEGNCKEKRKINI